MKAIKYAVVAIALFISFCVEMQGQCDAPELFRQDFVDADSLVAKWKPTDNTEHYNLEIRKVGSSGWTSYTSNTFQYTFTGLIPCTVYEMRVQKVCISGGTSSWSPITEVVTSDCLPVLSRVEIRAAAVSTGNEIYLRWIPTSLASMKWGTKYGYTISRTTLMRGDTSISASERRNSKIILNAMARPISDSTHWNNLAANNDMYGVAAGALFGEEMVAQSVDSVDIMDVVSMNQAEETQFSFGLFAADSDFAIAEEMALGYLDANVVAGEQYLYTVELNNINSTITKGGSDSKVKSTNDILQLQPVSDLLGSGGDSLVFLNWDNSVTEDVYSSFIVERSDDGGNTYFKVNNDPIIYTSNIGDTPGRINFNDGLPDNTNTYIFRVKGKSPFGIDGPPSDTIHVKGRPDPLPVSPSLTNVEELEIGTLEITWTFDGNYESGILGFEVLRAPDRDSLYVPITTDLLASNTRGFTDTNPGPLGYYKVVATDKNNHKLSSLTVLGQIADETPPDAPLGLSGKIEDNGIMTLGWIPSTSSDVMGYRVYVSNQETGEYSQITKKYVKDEVFYYQIDPSMMADFLYVGVKAIDRHENYSDMSSILALKRPDKVPPSAPLFSSLEAGYSSIEMEWELSYSNDVRFHRLERKVMNQPGWTEIITFDQFNRINEYNDISTEAGVWYEYRLLAYDEAGNFSSSNIVKTRGIDSGVRIGINDLVGQLLNNTGNPTVNAVTKSSFTINLNWTYPDEYSNLIGFTIFRGADSTNMRTFKTISVEEAINMASGFGGGNGRSYGFIDDDLFFGLNVRTNYTIPSRYNPANPGNVRTNSTTNSPVFVNVHRNNPNIPPLPSTPNPNPNHDDIPTTGSGNTTPQVPANLELYYQVMAVFSDGSMSHLSNFAIITF